MWDGCAAKTPWWWARIILIERHVQALHERAAYDEEKMVPPKQYWTLSRSEDLDAWFEDRDELRKQRHGR